MEQLHRWTPWIKFLSHKYIITLTLVWYTYILHSCEYDNASIYVCAYYIPVNCEIVQQNFYTLLWDMEDNDGYIKVVSVMQKFFDQGISGNWSYNPENYENNEVPLSVMATDLLKTYKYGWKTSYYQNTYDMKTDEVVEVKDDPLPVQEDLDNEECEACAI